MKKKILFVSLIFLFALISSLFFNLVSAIDIKTDSYTYKQTITPTMSNWSYIARNGKDWMNFAEGDTPYLTLSNPLGAAGVFKVENAIISKYVDNLSLITQFYNETDQCYLLQNEGGSSVMTLSVPVSEGTQTFLDGKIEIIFLQVIFPGSSGNTYFYLYAQDVMYFKSFVNFTFSSGWGSDLTAHFYCVQTGLPEELLFEIEYHYDNVCNIYYLFHHWVIEYNMPSKIVIYPYELVEYEDSVPSAIGIVAYGEWYSTTTSLYKLDFRIQQFVSDFRPVFVFEYDSSRFNQYYYNRILLHTLKQNIAYTYQDIFSYSFLDYNYMSDYVLYVNLSCSESNDVFVSFITYIYAYNSTTSVNFLYTNITTTETKITLPNFTKNLKTWVFNTRYKCLSLKTIINYLFVEVSFIYVGTSPLIIDFLLTLLPSLLILIIPAGFSYIKFKRSGFLLVFFVSTLIITIIQLIPLITGILMMIVEIIIFLKLMQKKEED